jgi:glycosyltransferase involved in cell wall biosynthesis
MWLHASGFPSSLPESSRINATSTSRSPAHRRNAVRFSARLACGALRDPGGARALLHLIGFDEPFGYSVVEAMACGTPVIAFRRGSMPELIVDGTTGFLVDDIDAAVAAVGCARALDRGVIRAHAVARFGRARMVDAYVEAYETVTNERR